MRIENIYWDQNLIWVPEGKTDNAARFVPMRDRMKTMLRVWYGSRKEGWVFPSSRSKSGHRISTRNWNHCGLRSTNATRERSLVRFWKMQPRGKRPSNGKCLIDWERMVDAVGIEPTTSRLRVECSQH